MIKAFRALFFVMGIALTAGAAASAQVHSPAGFTIPQALGVNIHFTEPKPGELEMISAAGFRWVRMDFDWNRTEPRKGQYDFSAYDSLVAALERHRLRALFILDYVNRHYDDSQSPHSEEGRAAFARWAAAAVKRFAGKGILWEIYNEPNITPFWRPKVNAADYVKLALATSKAIKEAARNEIVIGPATSGIDLPFLEECFRSGLLRYWDAVSVHPYRQTAPESGEEDYRKLRLLIERYAPPGRKIPVLSGEWGYSAAWRGFDEGKQSKMLPRQFLFNLHNKVPLSIWYDWRDDGPDPQEPEHHFGTVRHRYREGESPVYEPKAAHTAMRTLSNTLDGYHYSKRLAVGGREDWVLLFSRGKETRIAAWTTSASPRTVMVPASPGVFRVVSIAGSPLPSVTATKSGLALNVTDSVRYYVPEKLNDLLRVAAAWERAPLEVAKNGPRLAVLPLTLENPLSRPIVARSESTRIRLKPGEIGVIPRLVDLGRPAEPIPIRYDWAIEGLGRLSQQTRLLARNPLRITVLPARADIDPNTSDALPVKVENPSGERFRGMIEITGLPDSASGRHRVVLDFKPGQREIIVAFAGAFRGQRYRVGARIKDQAGRTVASIPERGYQPLRAGAAARGLGGLSAFTVIADGDPKVRAEYTITQGLPTDVGPFGPARAARLDYSFTPGWKFLRVPATGQAAGPIDGKPRGVGMWVYGDNQGLRARIRFTDSAGQTFQPEGVDLTWAGWRYVTFPLDGSGAGHWGGTNDGTVRYPIRLDTLFLLDNVSREAAQGTVYFASPTLIF